MSFPTMEIDLDLFAVFGAYLMVSIDPDAVATLDSDGATAIDSARVKAAADSEGVPALDSDRAAVHGWDGMAVIKSDGVSEIDPYVMAGTNLDVMIAIDLCRSAENSWRAVVADLDGGVVINSVVVCQDVVVVVSSDVAVEIALDVPVQAVLDSDWMVAMDSDVVAIMDPAAVITMRDSG